MQPLASPNPVTSNIAPGYPTIEIGGRRYVRPEILGEILNVSPRTLNRWAARREGPPRISLGKLILYDLDKIPTWLEIFERLPIRAGKRT